jgi:ligand-binding SRPBCC domain-containing protein
MSRIHLETRVRAPIARVFDLARDLDFHTRSMEHTGERIVGGRRGGLIEMGEEVEWEASHFGLKLRLRSRITAMDRPRSFVDEQVTGTFSYFVHRHEFREEGDVTVMTDIWEHRTPLGPLGSIADALFLDRYMTRLLETRNAVLAREAEQTS